jgi:ATP-binding cassette, subfamily B, bacterial
VWYTVLGYLLLEGLLFAARTALHSAGRLVDANLNHVLRFSIMRQIMEHAAKLDLSSYERKEFHERVQRISDETPWRVQEILKAIFDVVGETAALLAVLFVITQLGGWYVVILFGTTVPAILIGLREGSLVYTWRKAWGKWYRYTDYFRHVVLLPPFVMEMRLFRLASHFIEQFWRSAQIFMRAYFWFEVRRQKLLAIKTLLPDLGYVCGFAALAHGVVRGTLTVGDGVLFIGAFKAAQVSLSTIAQAIGDLYESYLFITDLREFLQTSPRLVPSPTARVLQPDEPLTVEFRQVWFRYAADAPYILRDVSFILVPGQGVALIGENGAGKTTLIKLLLRFYDPSEGQILINGTDLRDIDLDSYYAKIGMIFQEPMRHEARVREQIGYGDLAALHDLERIRYAAQWGVPRRSLTNFLGGLKPIWAHGNWKSTRKSSPADNGNAWLWLAP